MESWREPAVKEGLSALLRGTVHTVTLSLGTKGLVQIRVFSRCDVDVNNIRWKETIVTFEGI